MRIWLFGLLLAGAAAAQDAPAISRQPQAAPPGKVRRNWIKRMVAAEPAFAERLSSWGIRDGQPGSRPAGRHGRKRVEEGSATQPRRGGTA